MLAVHWREGADGGVTLGCALADASARTLGYVDVVDNDLLTNFEVSSCELVVCI